MIFSNPAYSNNCQWRQQHGCTQYSACTYIIICTVHVSVVTMECNRAWKSGATVYVIAKNRDDNTLHCFVCQHVNLATTSCRSCQLSGLININYLRQQGGGYVIVLSFCKDDNWRTRKRTFFFVLRWSIQQTSMERLNRLREANSQWKGIPIGNGPSKEWIFKSISTNWQWHKYYLFSLEALVCRDETERW